MQISFNQQLNSNPLITKRQNRFKYPNLMPLSQDTVSFKARYARPKDLMDLKSAEIIQVCMDALKRNILIGEGQEASVYKIPDYAMQYCIRREKNSNGPLSKLKLSYKLNDYDKANFVVAKLGEGVSILKFVPGIPLKIMNNHDTPSGKKVKQALQELVANNFEEEPFIRAIGLIEQNRAKGIVFDRKGENLLVDAITQEITPIDYSPEFNDIEYNPIAYIYHALDVDKTEHAPKVLGKLCKAYAERLKTADISELNLDVLDKNFYYRGFMDDAFNYFPNRKVLEDVRKMLFEELLEAKKTKTPEEFATDVDYFKWYVDFHLIDFFNLVD